MDLTNERDIRVGTIRHMEGLVTMIMDIQKDRMVVVEFCQGDTHIFSGERQLFTMLNDGVNPI